MRVSTPAKINLGLEILGRREDGYHEIVTVMQSVSIFDHFEFEPGVHPFSYRASIHELAGSDIVRDVLESAPDRETWTGTLTLKKNVPLAAGLGGGSSDAACALRFAYPDAGYDELNRHAARIGSDAPFFLHAGTALATGTGVRLRALPDFDAWYVIVCPDLDLELESKTEQLYQGLRPDDFSNGSTTMEYAERLAGSHGAPEIPPNAFEEQMRQYASVESAWTAMEEKTANGINLSGAGPSLYAQFMNSESAIALYERMRHRYETYLCRSTGRLANREQIRDLARAMRTGIMSD